MTYRSIMISPPVFLKCVRTTLDYRGIEFRRMSVENLDDLNGLGHDVLINVSGSRAKHMAPIAGSSLVPFRLQSFEGGGAKAERETVNGQTVVHAYVQEAGGYIYSFGMAGAASELVAQCVYELPVASHL